GNILSRPVSNDRVTMVDITAESDFTNDSTVDKDIQSIRTSADVFFYCPSMHWRVVMAEVEFRPRTS
ncbi:MAG: hypothetical protein ACKPKO_20115, partial [Candidatus Fonsibacter sp.]